MALFDRRSVVASIAGLVSAYGLTACESDGPTRANTVRFEGGRRLFADVVVYGASPAGIIAAAEASDAGCSVVLVGGWRERHLGGMMSGGLGLTDYRDPDAIGGRARRLLDAIANKHVGSRFAFDPASAEQAFEKMLARRSIPVVWTNGVDGVEKRGITVEALTTADGLKACGRIFIDASYEGDLASLSGVEMAVGREAADRWNPQNGFEGGGRGDENQFALGGRLFNIDPRVSSESDNLLPGVSRSTGRTGQADFAVQAYNFRLTMTEIPAMRLELGASQPDGYNPLQYEALLRLFEAARLGGLRYGRDWSLSRDLLKISPLGNGLLDVNARGPLTTDWLGGSWAYPSAGYAEREHIWKAHERYTRGLFYTLAHGTDTRVPRELKAEAARLGLSRNNYTRPVHGDEIGWPYQLYVREARRLVGETVWTAADLDAQEISSERAAKPVAVTSYSQDCHPLQRLAIPDGGGGVKLWNEGGINRPVGERHRSFLPYAIVCPRRTQSSNLLVPFCVSASHQAFSAIRIEATAMALGQACGAAASLAVAHGVSAIQDVPYDELRKKLEVGGQVLKPWNPVSGAVADIESRLFVSKTSEL